MRRLQVVLALAAALGTGACRDRAVVSLALTGAEDVPPAWSMARLGARATYSDGSSADVSGEVAWASSDVAVVRVEPDGALRAGRRGAATITAQLHGVEAAATLVAGAFRQLGASAAPLPAGVVPAAMGVDGAGRVTLVAASASLPAAPAAVMRGSATSPPTWDPAAALTVPAPAVYGSPAPRVTLAMNGSGKAAYLFPAETQKNALAYLDGGAWGWVREEPSFGTAIAIDDAGIVFVARRNALDHLEVSRLDAGGPIDVTEFPEWAGLAALSTAGGRTMVFNPGTGTRVFDADGWSTVAPLPAYAQEARLQLREDGTADLLDHSGDGLTHRRHDGVAWSDPVTVATVAETVSLSFGPGGTITASYTVDLLRDELATRLLVRHFDGRAWGEPIEIARRLRQDVAHAVVTDDTGLTVVLWSESSVSAWASAFDGAPPVVQSLLGAAAPSLFAAAFRPAGDLLVLGTNGVAVCYAFQP